MVAISFSVFKDKILSGEKTQTIRPYSPKRYGQIKKIERLQLYWKQRTKECELLREVNLESIDIIRLYAPYNLAAFDSQGTTVGHIHRWSGKRWMLVDQKEFFDTCKRDGFETIADMYEWFRRKYKDRRYNMVFMRIRWKGGEEN